MKDFTLSIKSITIMVHDYHADLVGVHTTLESPTGLSPAPLDLEFKAAKGTGAEYVRRVFGIEPEVLEV